jgi:hypothetical protein
MSALRPIPRPDEPFVRVTIGYDAYRVYFEAGAPAFVVRESGLGFNGLGLPLRECAPDSTHRIAAERAEAFVAQLRLPAVAS